MALSRNLKRIGMAAYNEKREQRDWIESQRPSLLTDADLLRISEAARLSVERTCAEYWAKGVTLHWAEAIEMLNAMQEIARLEEQDGTEPSPYILGGETRSTISQPIIF